MARSTREWAHRKLNATENALNNALLHLQDIVDKYEKEHTEISQPLVASQVLIVEVRDLITKMRQVF